MQIYYTDYACNSIVSLDLRYTVDAVVLEEGVKQQDWKVSCKLRVPLLSRCIW